MISTTFVGTNDLQLYRFEKPINQQFPRHNQFELILYQGGIGQQQVDFRTYPVDPNSLFLMAPNSAYSIQSGVGQSLAGWRLLINPSVIAVIWQDYSKFFCPFLGQHRVGLSSSSAIQLDAGLLNVQQELTTQAYNYQPIVLSVLQTVLLRVERAFVDQFAHQKPAHHELIDRLIQRINQDYQRVHLAQYYADQLHVSLKQLNRICQTHLGKNATTLIAERINLESKRLLFHGDQRVKEVAYSLGFEDPSYFVRFFNRLNGMTPQRFRDEMAEKYREKGSKAPDWPLP